MSQPLCDPIQALAGRHDIVVREREVVVHAGRGDLPRWFLSMGMTTGAEVGVWKGGFAEILCSRMPGLRLMCVDAWEAYAGYREQKNSQTDLDRAYEEAVTRLEPYHCHLVRARSTEAARHVPDRSLDFVYLDANHERTYVLEDLAAWEPKVRRGGVVAGHDYREAVASKPFLQVKTAVDEYVRAHEISQLLVFVGDKTPSFAWVTS